MAVRRAVRLLNCFKDQWHRKNRFFIVKEVESPHTTRFYFDPTEPHLQNAGSYWTNQDSNSPKPFPNALETVRQRITPLVNDLISSRGRLPYEWAGDWRPNVAAANCYANSKESVGFHSDRLNYLGPQTTICSLSLGVTRNFRLRNQTQQARTFDISLPHNSLLLMHAGCQESFKHSVPPQRTVRNTQPRFSGFVFTNGLLRLTCSKPKFPTNRHRECIRRWVQMAAPASQNASTSLFAFTDRISPLIHFQVILTPLARSHRSLDVSVMRHAYFDRT